MPTNHQVERKQKKQVQFKAGKIKFSRLYTQTNFYFRWACAAMLGITMSFIVLLLVENTGLYVGGVTALFQGVARLARVAMYETGMSHASVEIIYDVMFWGLYLLFNIPLLIFAYVKMNKEFAILTGTYLFFMQLLGFCWAAFIPGFNDIAIFGSTATVDANLASMGVQNIIFTPNVFPTSSDRTINGEWIWTNPNSNPPVSMVWSVTNTNLARFGLLLLYSTAFACCTGVVWSLMYILGGCSAGTDITSIFYSQEKNKTLGGMIIIICVSSMVLGIFLGSYVSSVMVDPSLYSGWQYFFSGTLIASLLWVVLNGFLIDRIFPWHQLVKVEIITNKTEQIREYLIQSNFAHPTTIITSKGGYSKQPNNVFMTVCMVVELSTLIERVRKIDEKCLIVATDISDIDGTINMRKQVG